MSIYKSNVEDNAQAKEDELEVLRHQAKMKTLELEGALIQLKDQINSSGQELATAQLAYKSLKADFDTYKRLNPESLHRERDELTKSVSKLRAERKGTNKRMQSLQGKLNIADKEVSEFNLFIYNYHSGLMARNSHIKGHVIELVDIKGIGQQTGDEIVNAVNRWAIRWSRENGDIEVYKSNLIKSTKPKKRSENA